MPAPVVLELGSATESPNAVELVEACSMVVGDAGCTLGDRKSAEPHRAVAIVSWAPNQLSARIEVGLRGRSGDTWRTRELVFDETDPEPERWRATGLAVGTLVGDVEADAEMETRSPAPQPDGPEEGTEERPPPASSERPVWLGIEAGVLAGPRAVERRMRVGGVFRVAGRAWSLPLDVLASLRYEVLPGGPWTAHWLAPAAGGAWTLDRRDWFLRFSAELGPSRIQALDPGSASRWVWVLSPGAVVGWKVTSHFVGFAGGEGAWQSSTTEIVVNGQSVGETRRFQVDLVAGARWEL